MQTLLHADLQLKEQISEVYDSEVVQAVVHSPVRLLSRVRKGKENTSF